MTLKAEVLDVMRARSMKHIPIVDKNGVVQGIHFMREIIGAQESDELQ